MTGHELMHDTIWFDQGKFEEAEAVGVLHKLGVSRKAVQSKGESTKDESCASPLINQIVKARENILQSLGGSESLTNSVQPDRLAALEKENKDLRKLVETLTSSLSKLEVRVQKLEGGSKTEASAPKPAAKEEANKDGEASSDDDDFDPFASDDEEDEENERIKAERVAKYKEKKANKPGPIAKSTIILDIKPWDDETDLAEIERLVREIKTDGLLWGGSKLVPVAYGIQKLCINCIVEDEKVGVDFLEEKITAFEDLVQSVDVAAFNKI